MRVYMKRILIVILVFIAGCATLTVPEQEGYPFRAEFNLEGMMGGKEISFNGAILITSATHGIIEVYGPGGLALYVIKIHDGTIDILDTWGRTLNTYTIPCKDLLGIIAGFPPHGRCIFRKARGDSIKVRYFWGKLTLDKDMLPISLLLKQDEYPVEVMFNPAGKMIRLMVSHHYDRFDVELFGKEGGRWR